MSIRLHVTADFLKMHLHGMGFGPRHHQRGANAPGRTDGAEQVSALVALVSRLTGSTAPFSPLPNLAVLLPNARFILKPDFDWLVLRQMALVLRQMAYVRLNCAREVFLKASMILAFCAGWRGRALMWEKPRAASSLEIVRS